MKKILPFILILSCLSSTIFGEFSYLGRSLEGLLMGDAFTALADDSSTLFYNPAALGRHSGVTISTLNPSFQFPDVLVKDFSLDNFNVGVTDRFSNFPSDPAGIANRILGFPLYLQLGINPSIKMENFGIMLFANSKTNMILENAIYPSLEIDYRLDRGFIAGYAFNFGSMNKKGNGNSFTVGASIKHINRQGLSGSFDLFGPELIALIESLSDYASLRKDLGYSKGDGWGLDTGIEFNRSSGSNRFTFGVSLLDVGDTRYKTEEGAGVVKQDMSLNYGMSYSGGDRFFGYSFALDYHNAIDPFTETMSKIHLGTRVNLTAMDLYMGWNAGYWSYGVALDFWMLRLLVGFYGVELGNTFNNRQGKRTVLTLNLLDFHFDI